MRGRLHNVTSGLCVGVVGKKAVEGAETALTTCSSDQDQQWSYEPEGLLRSADAPDLCMDSHLGYSVVLAPCKAAAKSDSKNIRYDFTLQGALVPRWDQDLALTPAATDASGALVVKARDDSPAQRWVIDTSKTDLQMEVVNWDADSVPARTPEAPPAPEASKSPTPTSTPEATPSTTPSTPRATPTPAPSTPSPTGESCTYNPYYCSGSGGYGGGYGGGGYPGGYGGTARRRVRRLRPVLRHRRALTGSRLASSAPCSVAARGSGLARASDPDDLERAPQRHHRGPARRAR